MPLVYGYFVDTMIIFASIMKDKESVVPRKPLAPVKKLVVIDISTTVEKKRTFRYKLANIAQPRN